MNEQPFSSLEECFGDLPDPRVQGRCDHKLEAPENFAVLRHIAINLLKRHRGKQSLKRKRFRAALDDNFLLELLSPI